MSSWQLAHLSGGLKTGDYSSIQQPDGANWRTRVIIPMDNGIVAIEVYNREEKRHYWYLPGGGVEGDETLIDCSIREVQEETGLKVSINRLMYIREFSDIPAIEFFLLAEYVSGKLAIGYDPELDAMPFTSVRVLSFDEIENNKELTFYPIGLRKRIHKDLKKPPTKALYIGRMP